MSRKYPSMQEELAAKKASGAYGDLSQYEKRFFRNEPEWVRKSREDYERSRRISNNGAGQSRWSFPGFNPSEKWSLRGKRIAEKRAEDSARRAAAASHSEIPRSGNAKWSLGGSDNNGWTESPSHQSGRQESSIRKQKTPKIPKQKANRRTIAAQRPRGSKAGCLIAIAILFVIIPMISAIIAVVGNIISDFGNDYTYDYEYTDNRSYEETGELDEYSSYSEAESYIKDNTETSGDDDTLTDWYYGGSYYDLLGEDDFCDIMDGRLYIWAECSEDDDPEEVINQWLDITNQYKEGLADAGIENVPVGVILKESESWDLKLVMIDGVIHFASGDYEDLGE